MLTYTKKANPEAFTAFSFVAAALSKDESRIALNYLYVTPDFVTATDGRRLHRAVNPENHEALLPGYYTVQKRTTGTLQLLKVDVAYTYPDVSQVLPNNIAYKKMHKDLLNNETLGPDMLNALINRLLPKRLCTRYEYIKAAYKIATHYGVGKNGVISIKGDMPATQAVIMPITLKGVVDE